jgi:hypothetical protein
MSIIDKNPTPTIQISNSKVNNSIINNNNTDFLIKECYENYNITNRNELDAIFNQKSPYNFPQLIICEDVKRKNDNNDIYQKYSDIIYDECGNRFNMRNLKDSAGLLQAGYSRNIDLDSQLKNINFYADRCYYNNWKMNPSDDKCNPLKYNAKLLYPNYEAVGGNDYNSSGACLDCCELPNTTDTNCDNNVRKRYDFTKQKLQTESCIKPADWTSFKHAPSPDIKNLSNFPNEKRNLELLNTLNKGVQHEYYQFFEQNKCQIFPQQRLFNNVTKRSMLPTHHNLEDIGPKYICSNY